MKSLVVKCAAFLLVVFAAALAQGQTDVGAVGRPTLEGYQFDFAGGGARAGAMGNAFLGLSDDVTAISWNPGGLFNLSQPVISISYGSTMPRGTTETDFYLLGRASSLDHGGSINGITSLNFAAPVRIKGHPFVGSFAYTTRYNEYQSFLFSYGFATIYNPVPGVLDTATFEVGEESQMDGAMKTASFGFGTRIYGNLSAGVALNVYSGTVVRTSVAAAGSDDLMDNLLQEYAYDEVSTLVDSNAFSGYNLTVGFKYTKSKLDLGLVVRTPFDLKVETDRSIYVIAYQNGLVVDAGTDTVYFDDLVAKYESPWMIGFGAAYHLSERAVVTADVEYRNYASQGVKLRDSLFLDPGGENEEFFTTVDADSLWRNVFQFRVGGEYLWRQSFGTIPLRAGFAYMPSVVPSYEPDSLVFVDTLGNYTIESSESGANGIRLSVGTGIWWKQIHLDIAYAYLNRDWDTGTPGYARSGLFHQKFKNHQVNATFTGYF